jgi:YidC/Oxa1 family membrane protein insertase
MLLTVIVRTVFWPLTHKSTMSMKRMSKLQPQMNAIREKFKANPQKMQAEIMALYRANKVNPFAGCLPLLIQIPVFIALFYVLRSAIELRYASFLWIRDLSEPERIFDFGFAIPILGWDALNLLPIAMTITMIIQMKVTPTAGDPQQQKIMMTIMPAMMLAMLYNYASGLALYWTTTNIISIAQQFYYRHLNKKEEAAEKAGLVAKPVGKK